MKFLVTAAGVVTDVITVPDLAAAELQLTASPGDTLHEMPASTGYINDALVEIVDGVVTRKSGVLGDVPGEGLEVVTIT